MTDNVIQLKGYQKPVQSQPRPHDWGPSTLGHGEQMCKRCFATNRELAALGQLNHCDAPDRTSPSVA